MEALQRALLPLGVAVAEIPGKGRGLVATRKFWPGDVIIQDEPYASTPNDFSTGSCCDGCFVSSSLKKCSACRMAWYCGSSCQKLEWKLHQLECKAFLELNDDRRKMLTPTLRLMLRLLLRRKLQNDQVIKTTETDNYRLVEALVSHMSDIEENQLVLYAQMANLVNMVLPELRINIKEIAEIFSKLACNAHTICDSEFQPLGTGLYPVISIINHSCVPNSVLVFEGRTGMVRAVETIEEGTEVSISYIDTAASTKKRQKDLKEQYFFVCSCQRCITEICKEDINKNSVLLDSFRCKGRKCRGFLHSDSQKRRFTCPQCGLSREYEDVKKAETEIKDLRDKASKSLSSGYYSESSFFYLKLEEHQAELFHSPSIDLLKTHENLLKIYMELKKWSKALEYCRLIIPVYEKLYPVIHPLIGLQHYTCGKLEWLLEQPEEALKSFTKAYDILRITHGGSTLFMKKLLSKLEEARTEVAYKFSHVARIPSSH